MFNVQKRKGNLGLENWPSVWKAIVSVPVLEEGGRCGGKEWGEMQGKVAEHIRDQSAETQA